MAGAPPYSSHSPSQSHYHSYSPPPNAKSHPLFYNPTPNNPNPDPYQHAPQTPPAFSSAAANNNIARSPRFGQQAPSPMNPALPPINGALDQQQQQQQQPQQHSPHYPSHHSSASPQQYQPLQRGYPSQSIPSKLANPYESSASSSHAHPVYQDIPPPPPRHEAAAMDAREGTNGHAAYPAHAAEVKASEPTPSRANTMSIATILGPSEEPPTPKQESPIAAKPLPPTPSKPVDPVKLAPLPKVDKAEKSVSPKRSDNFVAYKAPAPPPAAPETNGKRASRAPSARNAAKQEKEKLLQQQQQQAQQQRRTLSDKEQERINRHMADIDELEKSDVEAPGFELEQEDYLKKSQKRAVELAEVEESKRKRRKVSTIKGLSDAFAKPSKAGAKKFRAAHEPKAVKDVHEKEIRDEKERKKDMQRKRRRENTVRSEEEKKRIAQARADEAEDEAERERYLREADKAQKKIKSTKRAMERGDGPEEISEVTPLAPNLEGGTTSSFHVGTRSSPDPPKKRSARSGASTRPKKSKEKKQAEKDAAEAAYAAMEKDEPVSIAPKEAPRKEALKKEAKAAQSKESSPLPTSPYDSKGYKQIYDQIWRDMARKDVPKVFRIKTVSLGTKQENLRKTAQLAGKQARKWQERTNKSTKDTQARAKRSMREMMTFWKRNEREERDLRRMAEKQELENAKKAEADREANRQKRKLNFLISQTELYSHFIGRKIKTDEIENSTNDASVAVSDQTVRPGKPDDRVATLASNSGGGSMANIDDLDFDAEDETALNQVAMARAQNAVQEAQDRARAFNGQDPENPMAGFDEGELNFQNPTSLGDVQVSQPKMLTAQLKEYQLKGLNWLVNLYEQGINGILADEMGLGKTVQSISVMGYLAEVHNIWGPFLVIAPASTLHNWQQEVSRFVPDIKVLPYWGSAKDRKVLRKFWDRKHITYTKDSEFHVLVTSYQLVVQDAQYFQKVKWQYMILDEAQAIKSSQSSRWKNLLGFHCRNRLLLTGTPIQNNMQELWALLHFIMPTLFDSHDEFSDWFSKDIESHAQSNTKLNEDQLKRLHMILKPFMLRRIKKHVQKELGDKVEIDVFCDLTYRQRALYASLRNRISIMDLIEKAAVGDDQDTATLMNLVMQFRKVCNHPDLFERADTKSPFAMAQFAETASFLREGNNVNVSYSSRSMIEYDLPRILCNSVGRLDIAGPGNDTAGFRNKYLGEIFNIWTPENIKRSCRDSETFSWLRFADTSVGEASGMQRKGMSQRVVDLRTKSDRLAHLPIVYDEEDANYTPAHALFNIVERNERRPLTDITSEGCLRTLMNVSKDTFDREGFGLIEPCAKPGATAPPIVISCSDQTSIVERDNTLFNIPFRKTLFPVSEKFEEKLLEYKVDPSQYPITDMMPKPLSAKGRYTHISVPSMRRFVTDSGKLAKLDALLHELKNGGHRVLLYFQMTRMIDLMEEYLTYRNYKYCRLDGSTKLEDRRDTVHDFQTRPEIFIFLLSTRAGGLGINLTTADTVIFYDSDWNPTIDSQAMDRAHRLGQTKQVTVYRLITRGTIEERIRKRALQKEEVQRVVISGGSGAGVDFNTRSKENRTKDIAMWLADDDEAELLEQRSREAAEKETQEANGGPGGGKKAPKAKAAPKRKRDITMDDMYHEGEGHFDDVSAKPSGAATPTSGAENGRAGAAGGKKGARGGKAGSSKRAKTTKERLRLIDGDGDLGMGGGM